MLEVDFILCLRHVTLVHCYHVDKTLVYAVSTNISKSLNLSGIDQHKVILDFSALTPCNLIFTNVKSKKSPLH